MTEGLLDKPAPGMTVRVPRCAACGQQHDDVIVRPLATPQAPFTHWFSCPVNGDPVPLSILMVDDQTAVAVHNQILAAAVRCLLARRYMIAFFRVEQGKLTVEEVFDEFPNGDFGRAVGLMYKHLLQRLDRKTLDVPLADGLLEASSAPMPTAVAPAPRVRLFGEMIESQ